MITVLCCISASGKVLKPLIINKGKTPTYYELHSGINKDSFVVGCSDSGWMTSNIFFTWMANHFHNELEESNIQRPVLLILDGHANHMSLYTLYFAKQNGILMYCLPSHSSHLMQPLDVSVFHPFKESYRNTFQKCWGDMNKQDMPKKHFASIFMKALNNSKASTNAISGFRSCDLVPFNSYTVPA